MTHIARPPATTHRTSLVPAWLFALTTLLSVAVALVSYRYLGAAPEIPEQIGANRFVSPWLVVHAGSAATALLLGPTQFSRKLRARRAALHRWMGRVYVLGCMAGGVSGLVLAAGASTGIPTVMGFGSLALAWLGSTGLAWYRAVHGDIGEHRAWMVRSFALTLAAVTLRVYLAILGIFELPFITGYQAISFLCWMPNLMLAEWLIRRRRARA
ncbi:DUF2306 domain-containing protein [Massilia dura]|uniref:DUF2306 domain-containing protein n=1 Tax=Pseudoduganella dura TaxID=321982 RepID=A0A6I3XW08_9BURK|nr:DUF2306 domain-containing protein [Pseudoduganella dura]MUI15925.1 DUF2306 domain-containing protein [Pseudoduganella dura]GGX94630.1 hypothetical protein GCM10007386_26890 [Pseudoduganella dura]